MNSRRHSIAILLIVLGLAACDSSPTDPTENGTGSGALDGFQLAGDPASPAGATWTYRATTGGVAYNLSGILFKPTGSGRFPAIIVSHGLGGSAVDYSRMLSSTMVAWGAVVVAVNYTHAGGVPIGTPGTADEPGASEPNVARGRKVLEVLRSLAYVDMSRVAAHGHSSGAFVTTALVGAEPQAFRAASHTAGAIRPDVAPDIARALPSETQASTIRAPYQIHHGDRDQVVPLLGDRLFDAFLSTRGVTHELIVYPGADHDDVAAAPEVLSRIRAWYAAHGVLP